jgi:signal recognition particle subunit SRP19
MRIEEVSDSDPDDMDPADFDPANEIITPSNFSPANIPSTGRSSTRAPPTRPLVPPAAAAAAPPPVAQREIPRSYKCIYPVYFDKTRSRQEGRKVSKKLAVENPLAREIFDAVQLLGLRVAFEGDKIHPKDWANPGRVRVGMRGEDGRSLNDGVKNSMSLRPSAWFT